jgi:molybdate transport system substrate-binding protein
VSRSRPALFTFVVPTVVAAVLGLSACGGSSSGGDSSSGGANAAGTPAKLSGQITVFAAASLTGSFTELGKSFEAANPGTKVTFSFGPSSGLATQITQGAPADVFASASPKNMTQIVDAKAAKGTPVNFAKNVMQIAVPKDNPGKVTQLSDLAKPDEKVVLCAAEVPCGATARQVFTNAKLTVKPVSNEVDVKATLAKVQLGEADAGVVYVTDVLAAGDKVTGIPIPADVNASTEYPIAALSASKNAAVADAFVAYVLSPTGATALTGAGFEKP